MSWPDFFLKKASHFKSHLQSLLEKKEVVDESISFQIQTDLSDIEDIRFGLPLSYPKKMEFLFAKLIPYFDGGVLFSKNENLWSPVRSFYNGHIVPLKSQDKKRQLQFPQLKLVEIRKASGLDVLKDLGIEVDPNIDAFLLMPHPDFTLLLLCSLSDPWRKIHFEKIQTQLLMAVSDIL